MNIMASLPQVYERRQRTVPADRPENWPSFYTEEQLAHMRSSLVNLRDGQDEYLDAPSLDDYYRSRKEQVNGHSRNE